LIYYMTDNWKSYLCNVNDTLASVRVNLGLRNEIPIMSKPWLLWLWVYFQSPRLDGLSDSSEAPILFEIEDALELQIARNCGGIPCGIITTEGRREFYYYAKNNEGFGEAVSETLTTFKGYKFDMGEQEDSAWKQYLDVLYPSPEKLQRISNRDLLDVLVDKGDVLSVVRRVCHWIYFPSEECRTAFKRAAIAANFAIISKSQSKRDLPFEIVVARSQPVNQEIMDVTVVELFRLALQFGGEYDGWETPIITQ